LQRELNAEPARARLGARNVHVGSIARSLVPCAALAAMLERVLPRYERLDLVVLMVGASDLVDWIERDCPGELGASPLALDAMFDEHCEKRCGWTRSTLALRRVASLWSRRLGRVERRERAGRKLIELRQRRRDASRWIDSVPDPAPMLTRFETHLERLIHLARGRGARVLLARQPWFEKELSAEEEALMWNFCIGRPYLEPSTAYYTHRVVGELMRAVDARAVTVAERAGVEHLDLMPALERSLTTYYDYLHFTPQGARAVAHAIARHLTASPPR
jgi:lysophospholipase L1-like esterase